MNFELQHTLADGQELLFTHLPDPAYLAIVDVETYQAYVSESLDYQGMIEHLGREMGFGHAIAWGCPESTLRIRIRVAGDYPLAEMAQPYSAAFHSWIRTSGNLCFTSHDNLYHSATASDWCLNGPDDGPEVFRPRQLCVPEGVYGMIVFRHFPWYEGDQEAPHLNDGVNYSIVLQECQRPPQPERFKRHVTWI